MRDHQILILWERGNTKVTVKHINQPTKEQAAVGDVITFKAEPEADVEVKLLSNFSDEPIAVITDSKPHRVTHLGDIPFECAVIEGDGTRHEGYGDSTKNPGPP